MYLEFLAVYQQSALGSWNVKCVILFCIVLMLSYGAILTLRPVICCCCCYLLWVCFVVTSLAIFIRTSFIVTNSCILTETLLHLLTALEQYCTHQNLSKATKTRILVVVWWQDTYGKSKREVSVQYPLELGLRSNTRTLINSLSQDDLQSFSLSHTFTQKRWTLQQIIIITSMVPLFGKTQCTSCHSYGDLLGIK